MRRRMAGVGLALVAVALLAAAAQVTRDEFDALKRDVQVLKGKVAILEARTRPKPQALLEVPSVLEILQGAPDQPAAQPLEGRDLLAWKLARDRVGSKGYAFLTPPTTACMTKTETGDYVFVLYTGLQQGDRSLRRREYTIKVTDYGTELRVSSVRARGEGIIPRHKARGSGPPAIERGSR